MKSLAPPAALLALFLLIGTSAGATTLTLEDCASCRGSDVSLDITTSDGGATYDVILTLDSTNYDGSGGDSIVQAGFKAFSGLSADDLISFSATSGSWTEPVLKGVGASGFCTGGGSSGFACSTGEANVVNSPGDYVFTYKIDGSDVTLLSTTDWSIKFQYCDSSDYDGGDGDCNGAIISERGPAVPEPSAALVFAVGLLTVAPKLRRRR